MFRMKRFSVGILPTSGVQACTSRLYREQLSLILETILAILAILFRFLHFRFFICAVANWAC